MKMNSGVFWGSINRDRYDLVYSQKIFRNSILYFLSMIGLQTSSLTPQGISFQSGWLIFYLGTAMLVYFVDIMIPTMLHNMRVYEYRQRKKSNKKNEKVIRKEIG